MKCTNPACRMYGKELSPGAKFCGVCGQIVKEESYGGFSDGPSGGPSGGSSGGGRGKGGYGGSLRGINRMPQGIALGVDERIVKQYKIGTYSFRQGSIDVIVTNKRVIRYEESSWLGMQNNQIDEINIDAVHGNFTRMRRSISILGLIVAIILLVVGFAALFGRFFGYYKSPLEYIVGVVALLIAVIIILSSLKPTMEFALLGAIGAPALGTFVNKRGRIIRDDSNSIIFQFKPTPQTTVMLKEIGACIYDLKTLGDAAIEKWS